MAATGKPKPCFPGAFVAIAVLGTAAAREHGDGAVAASELERIEETTLEFTGGDCGVKRLYDTTASKFLLSDTLEPRCNTMMITNCSVTYGTHHCPSECEYLVPHYAFACLFTCAARKDCATGNPNRAFPDSSARLCRQCHIEGCRLCDTPTKCAECHETFDLAADGSKCAFALDKTVRFDWVLKGLGAVIFGIIVLAMVWQLVFGMHEKYEDNTFAVLRARRHRRMTKVQDWHIRGYRGIISERYNFFVDMHTKNILGVGIALFYNSAVFTIFVAILFFGVVFWIYSDPAAHETLSSFDQDQEDLLESAVKIPQLAPAIEMSRLAVCTTRNHQPLAVLLEQLARRHFEAISVLYVTLFTSLLVYGCFQKRFKSTFDSKNATMSDHAFRVRGLPATLTNEGEIAEWLQGEFRKKIPGSFERPPKYADGYLGVSAQAQPDSAIEVYGVSICYDYRDIVGEVEEMVQTMNTRFEVQEAIKGNRKLTWKYIGGSVDDVIMQRELHREKVTSWFDGENKMMSNGTAFVVFNYNADLERVWAAYEKDPTNFLRHPDRPEDPVTIDAVHSEPPSVCWWHMGTARAEQTWNGIQCVCKIMLMITVAQVIVLLLYVKPILVPYSRIGSAAGGTKIVVMGQVIGIVNQLLGMQIWGACTKVGFHVKEEMDTLVLFLNTFMYSLNIALNVVVSILTVAGQDGSVNDQFGKGHAAHAFLDVHNLMAVSAQNTLARNIYLMMMPGTFFVGFLMTIVMAGIWPILWNTFLMKLIYVWRALPTGLLKIFRAILPWAPDDLGNYPYWRAEKALEPMEVQIGDYAHIIVIPTVCSSMLVFMSPYTYRIFNMMLIWAMFFYFYLRYVHLRFAKTCYYTADITDNFVNILWGVPLANVGFAWAVWGIRSGNLAVTWSVSAQITLLAVTWFAAGGLWVVCYQFGVNPWVSKVLQEQNSLSFGEVKAHTVYSWFNCNPIFALKCEYYFKDPKGRHIKERRKAHPVACGVDDKQVRFYTVGKEFLFVQAELQDKAIEQSSNINGARFEIEYWVESLFALLQLCTTLGRRHINTINQQVIRQSRALYDASGTDLEALQRLLVSDEPPEEAAPS